MGIGRAARSSAKRVLANALAGRLLGSPGPRPADDARVPATPAPGPGAMTVYTVTNLSGAVLNVEHVFANDSGFSYSFWSQVPAGGSATYHVRDISQVPRSFQGTLNLYADQPFSVQIVGYDYPSSGNNSQFGSVGPRAWLPVVTR